MKTTNQIVVLSGILVILATATIAASNLVQPAKAAYGNDIIKGGAQCTSANTCGGAAGNSGNTGNWGGDVSSAARDTSSASTHQGLGDWRANGDKVGDNNNGQGGPNFR